MIYLVLKPTVVELSACVDEEETCILLHTNLSCYGFQFQGSSVWCLEFSGFNFKKLSVSCLVLIFVWFIGVEELTVTDFDQRLPRLTRALL